MLKHRVCLYVWKVQSCMAQRRRETKSRGRVYATFEFRLLAVVHQERCPRRRTPKPDPIPRRCPVKGEWPFWSLRTKSALMSRPDTMSCAELSRKGLTCWWRPSEGDYSTSHPKAHSHPDRMLWAAPNRPGRGWCIDGCQVKGGNRWQWRTSHVVEWVGWDHHWGRRWG